MKFNTHPRRKIDGLIVLFCRLEFNLLRRANRGFIQTMAQPADDPVDMHRAISEENQIQDNVALKL